jgi:hypothetical protein
VKKLGVRFDGAKRDYGQSSRRFAIPGQGSAGKQPDRMRDAVDRFSEPNSAGLRPGTVAAFGSHSYFRSLKASQHIRQNLLMARSDKSRGSGGAPASLQPATPKSSSVFQSLPTGQTLSPV